MSYTKYRQEIEALENAYARRLLIEYDIREVTRKDKLKMVQENLSFLYLHMLILMSITRNG